MTSGAHGLIHFLSSCKQQATKTKPQAAAKQEVNLSKSVNSLWSVTQRKVIFQTMKVIPNISKYKLNNLKNRAQHHTSENACKKGEKGLPSIKPTLCQGFSRTSTYVHHWMLCAQTRTDPLLRQQAAGACQLPRKLAADPPFTCSSHGSWHQIWHRSPHRLLSVPQALSKGMHTEQRSLLEAMAQRDFTEQHWFEAGFLLFLSRRKLCISVARQIQSQFWLQFREFKVSLRSGHYSHIGRFSLLKSKPAI